MVCPHTGPEVPREFTRDVDFAVAVDSRNLEAEPVFFPSLSAAVLRRGHACQLPGVPVAALALPDLVKAKKTQRDKDWPMIRR